jgi:hypothetical protein
VENWEWFVVGGFHGVFSKVVGEENHFVLLSRAVKALGVSTVMARKSVCNTKIGRNEENPLQPLLSIPSRF